MNKKNLKIKKTFLISFLYEKISYLKIKNLLQDIISRNIKLYNLRNKDIILNI